MALRFDFPGYKIETDQRKGVSIDVLEPGENAAPNRRLFFRLPPDASQPRRKTKRNATPAPFFIFSDHILGDENNPGRPSDELILLGIRRGRHQRKDCGTVWWRDRYPAFTRLNPRVEGHMESELIHVESQTSI